jgi:ATP-binding cassette subfamily B protein
MRRFIDVTQTVSVDEATSKRLFWSAMLFMGVALMQQAISVLAMYVSQKVAWTATNALRADLAEHCLRLDMSFHNARTPGEMIERIDGDVTALSNFFSQFVIQVFGNAMLLLGILVLLYREDWRVGLALSVFSGLAMFVLLRFRNIAVPHWTASRQASADLFGFLEERLAGTEDIRSSGANAYVMRRFYELMRVFYRRELKAGLMVNIMINTTELLFTFGNTAAFVIGAYLFRGNEISIGTVYIIFQYSGMLMMPIQRITQQMEQLQRASAGIGRIRELFNIHGRITDPPHRPSQRLPERALALAFDSVSFGYDDAAPFEAEASQNDDAAGEEEAGREPEASDKEIVLHNVSFHLQPGRILGVLGRTGSGKTTLTRLIFRLYDPDNGMVRIGGEDTLLDVRDVPLDTLRQRVGMVTQNIQLFHASVRDNLTFFDRDIPDARILEVIHALGLGAWYASLENGLDTELESGGGGLSAGEAQLLAFTRIFLKDPGLVILDEASSRLDPATEDLIERAVDRLVQNRTALIIAHRLGTVERADEIMILDKGRIIEQGEREALASDPNAHFYHLLQTGLEEVLA